jgi:hypothetical protein
MPAEHRNLYVSTTLVIVIFTTIFCGGLTEPMLTQMGMRVDKAEVAIDARSPRRRMNIVAKDDGIRRRDQQGNGSVIFRSFSSLLNRVTAPQDVAEDHADYEVFSIQPNHVKI